MTMLLAVLGLAGAACAQSCPTIEPMTMAFGLDGPAHFSSIFDEDGPGPAPARLFLSGAFTVAAGEAAPGLARWDGETLSAVEGTPEGPKGALRVYDDGAGEAIYVGGEPGIVRRYFGGGAWDQIPAPAFEGHAGTAESFAAFDPDGNGPRPLALFALLHYPELAGEENSVLWRYDAQGWYRLSGPVRRGKIIAYDPDNRGPQPWELYHYYNVTRTNPDRTTGYIWRLTPDHWEFIAHTNGGPSEGIFDATVYVGGTANPVLVIVGKFRSLFPAFGGELPVNNAAAFDYFNWRRLPVPVFGARSRITAVGTYRDQDIPRLVITGDYRWSAEPVGFHWEVFWTGGQGAAMDALGDPRRLHSNAGTHVRAFDPDGSGPVRPQLVIAGATGFASQQPVRNFAAWAPPALAAGWKGGLESPMGAAHAAAVFDDGTGRGLFAGGNFWSVGDRQLRHIARWDGDSWRPVGGGLGVGSMPTLATVTALAPHFDGSAWALYAGVRYRDHFGQRPANVWRWDGQTWEVLDTRPALGIANTEATIHTLASFDPGGPGGAPPELYAAGQFQSIGGIYAPLLAVWDGHAWGAVPGLIGQDIHAAKVLDDGSGPALYIAGYRLEMPGLPRTPLLRRTREGWEAFAFSETMRIVDVGLDNSTGEYKLVIQRSAPGGAVLSRREAPGVWSTFVPPYPGMHGPIRNVPDGDGPALYAGTLRFRGSGWESLGAPSTVINSMTPVFDDGSGPSVFITTSNQFLTEAGLPVGTVGRIRLCPGLAGAGCAANCDGSTALPVLNASDLVCFLQRYAAGDPRANCDGSREAPALTVADFTCFVRTFAQGCR